MLALVRPSCSVVLTFFALLCASAVGAQPELSCGLESSLGASLLLPYFEVDLEDQSGASTLFAVGNADDQAILARAVVWTNWGHPVLAFDFGIEAKSVRPFNLRDVLAGRLPTTDPPAVDEEQRFSSCAQPVVLPQVDPEGLRNLLTGGPRQADGLCYAEAVEGGRLATGYITVDVVNDCSGGGGLTPTDTGYFGDCASGLAANDNVLWGDFFLVDPSQDYAQGEKLVVVSADQTRFGNDVCVDPPCGTRLWTSFYDAQSNRMPLPSAYETRFLNGGAFTGGTDLLLWTKGQIGPAECANTETAEGTPRFQLEIRTERGASIGTVLVESRQLARRLRVGSEDLPLTESAGLMEVSAWLGDFHSLQLWAMPLLSAEGRFGVGLSATPVGDFCF